MRKEWIAIGAISACVAALALWWASERSPALRDAPTDMSLAPPPTAPASSLTPKSAVESPALPIADAPPQFGEPGVFLAPGAARRVNVPKEAFPGAMSMNGHPNLAANYDALAARAKAGDIAAARKLGTGLMACRIQRDQLRDVNESISPVRMFRDEAERNSAFARADGVINSEHFRTVERNCEGITEQQIASASDWYLLAAERGDAQSVLGYVTATGLRFDQLVQDPAALQRYRDTAARLMHRGARRCAPVVFAHLAASYQRGHWEAPDPVRALAYFWSDSGRTAARRRT